MKRIKEFKKMFGVEGALELKQLKKQYRNLVKEWHPDKFPDGGEKAEEAEAPKKWNTLVRSTWDPRSQKPFGRSTRSGCASLKSQTF